MIVSLDRRFVVYPGGAGVDEGEELIEKLKKITIGRSGMRNLGPLSLSLPSDVCV